MMGRPDHVLLLPIPSNFILYLLIPSPNLILVFSYVIQFHSTHLKDIKVQSNVYAWQLHSSVTLLKTNKQKNHCLHSRCFLMSSNCGLGFWYLCDSWHNANDLGSSILNKANNHPLKSPRLARYRSLKSDWDIEVALFQNIKSSLHFISLLPTSFIILI